MVASVDAERAVRLAAVEAQPENPDAHLALGRLYLQRQAFRRACASLRRARGFAPQNPHVVAHLADIAVVAGAHRAAAWGYEVAARRANWPAEWTFLAANAFCDLGWPDAAMPLFRRLPSALPDWSAWVQQRGNALLAAHWQTVRTYLPMLRSGSIDIGPGRDLLHALTGIGRLRLAERVATCLGADHPQDPLLTAHRARLAFRRRGAEAGLAILAGSMAAGIVADIALAARLAMELDDPVRAIRLLSAVPQDDWSEGAWTQACRVMIVTEDAAGLVDLASAWEARSTLLHCTPVQFALEGLRLDGRLPLLGAKTPSGTAPAGQAPEGHLVHYWDSPQPPADVAATLASWRRMNPTLKQTILHLESARAFILTEHGDRARQCFDLCHHAAMQSDYLRLLWLVTHGGLYADADEACVASVAPLLEALADSELVVVLAGHSPPYLNNCVLGARRGSPLLAAAAEEVTTRMLAAAEEGRQLSIWDDTGPGLLTRIVGRALGQATTPAEARRVATLIPDLRVFAHNDLDLTYKRTTAGNWRLA